MSILRRLFHRKKPLSEADDRYLSRLREAERIRGYTQVLTQPPTKTPEQSLRWLNERKAALREGRRPE